MKKNKTLRSFFKTILPQTVKEYSYFLTAFLSQKFDNKILKKEIFSLSREENQKGEKLRIFIWEPGGYSFFFNVFGPLAWALKLRGCSVKLLLCRGSKIACTKRNFFPKDNPENWHKSCKRCSLLCSEYVKAFNLDYGFIDDYIKKERLKELFELARNVKLENIYGFCFKGYYIGKNVYSSFRRYLKGRPMLKEQENVLRYYLYAGLANIEMAENFIAKEKPDRIMISQGAYTDYGSPIKVFFKNKIPVSIGLFGLWYNNTTENYQSFSFLENPEKVSLQMISEKTWQRYKNKPLSKSENKQLDNFFLDTYRNTEGKANFYDFENNNPTWCIFAHLIWDAVDDMYPMIYKNFDEWIISTLKEISRIKDINWLIKVHPVEFFQPEGSQKNYGVLDVIRENFGDLPPHIKILKSDKTMNNLDLYKSITGGITAVGTAGLELAVMGKPVLLSGDTHYAKKGFTYDASSRQRYVYYLRNIRKLKSLSESQIKKARRYAYLYFIKKQIPFDYFRKENIDSLDPQKIKNIVPGKDKYIDFICDCIINKKDFVLP